MRVTTQMLNESARRAGLPIHNTSLLNYINNNNSGNTLLSALNKNSNTTNTVSKTKYDQLEKTADRLAEEASTLTSSKEDSVFAKAKESGDNQGICNAVVDLIGKYNSTLSALKSTPGSLNDYYGQMLKSAASDNKEALESVGITIARDGALSVDKDKLKAADIDTLEKVFGSASGFSGKTAYVAERISDNAQASQSSLSNQYSSTGALYSALSNKYNFWG